jgi:D-alanyl-lipoteichoic acid acyltransferase DltB (MBOAT superfamily)
MLFNSFIYILAFLPVVAVAYAAVQKYAGQRPAQGLLLAASLVFYGWTNPHHIPLLLGSIVFNWFIARQMQSPEGIRRKLLLQTGLVVNIALLCCFKYVNFLFGAILGNSFTLAGHKLTLPDWTFPLGISFYTLTQIMYLVDTYQGLNDASSLFDHAAFVSMFPYISSGPLVRARSIIRQLRDPNTNQPRFELACRGFYLFTLGLAKKMMLADSFAKVADAGFGGLRPYTTAEAWAFSLAYTFQIYFDFSGYSDMAVGSAWMLGIDIPQNFNAPLRAKSISEFWQRWHISLSNFITNYLYTPILRAMGKATLQTSAVAIMLAMGIAGLWHGPAMTFIVFGLLHGAGLAINQWWKKNKKKMPDGLGWLLTLILVNSAFVFFRSPNVDFAENMLIAMLPHGDWAGNLTSLANLKSVFPMTPVLYERLIALGVISAFFFQTSAEMAESFERTRFRTLATATLVWLGFFFLNAAAPKGFVYFAF